MLFGLVVAAVNWWAVATDRGGTERWAKPLTMVFLFGLLLTIDAVPPATKPWFLVALAAGLVGDVLLLPSIDRFLPGLIAFAVGHLAYVGGLLQIDRNAPLLLVGLAVGAALLVYLGLPIVKAVWPGSMGRPVAFYIAVVACVVALAIGTGRWLLAFGGIAFALSDAMLGFDRFVRPAPRRRVLVHMLYHTGQACLVLGLDPDFPP